MGSPDAGGVYVSALEELRQTVEGVSPVRLLLGRRASAPEAAVLDGDLRLGGTLEGEHDLDVGAVGPGHAQRPVLGRLADRRRIAREPRGAPPGVAPRLENVPHGGRERSAAA